MSERILVDTKGLTSEKKKLDLRVILIKTAKKVETSIHLSGLQL
jgi:hypothetical protein